MILGRVEGTLETNQLEEQHGFCSNSRIEEHLLTFNLILDKALEMDQPLWIISFDLSKAFDRANWESLWQAVGGHGVSQHLVWILQSLYYQQRGKIVGVFSAHVCFVHSLNGHCPNGGRNAIFAKSYEEIGQVLDMLVDALRQAGLVLDAEKTKILTTQSQHRANIQQKLDRLAG